MKLAERDEAAVLAGLPAEATVALGDIAGAIREGLLAFSCSAGLLVVQQLMVEEMTAKVGPKGRHDPQRVATRNGSAPGSVVLGGRRVPLRRPRATLTGGGELTLDSYAVFSSTDLLTQLAVERMLAGVATRRHGAVAEPIGAALEDVARGDSRSAISRRFKAATETALSELLARDLGELDVAVLMIDGIMFAEVCCVVALAITADGTKVPVGLWDGDTENGTVVTDLLADLVARGLRYDHGLLVVIDGAKALAAGVKRVFGLPSAGATLRPPQEKELCWRTCLTSSAGSPTASWPRRSTIPTRPAVSGSSRASPASSKRSTPRRRRACAKGSMTCSPCAASGSATASPDRCHAPTRSSR